VTAGPLNYTERGRLLGKEKKKRKRIGENPLLHLSTDREEEKKGE